MFINNFDPVAINFFSLEIRWYSLAYIFGILAGWVLAKRFFIINQDIKTKFDDYVTYLIFGIIIGIIIVKFNILPEVLDFFNQSGLNDLTIETLEGLKE